jgi:hypothetical protein
MPAKNSFLVTGCDLTTHKSNNSNHIDDARVAAKTKAATNMSPSHWAKTEENVEKSLRVEYLFG